MTEHARGWCSLRLRFDERELELLRGAEQLRGVAIARSSGRDELRTALQLAKAGQKVGHSLPGGSVSLEEGELGLLVEALQFASREVPVATRADGADVQRREAVLAAFPELVVKGSWRSFGLGRELEVLARRLNAALHT
jgi:hypothetical protein